MTADLATVLLAEDDRHDGQGYYQTGAAVSLDDIAEPFAKVLNRDIHYEAIGVDAWEAIDHAAAFARAS